MFNQKRNKNVCTLSLFIGTDFRINKNELSERSTEMLKAAILGCGGIANTHARILTELEDKVQITALCDIAKERAVGFNERYAKNQATVFTDFTQMYQEAEIDVVYICLPPFAHTNEVQLAAECGIHVFIEKPIALSMDIANQMVEAVEKHGVKSQVGFMSRFGAAVERVNKRNGDYIQKRRGCVCNRHQWRHTWEMAQRV